MRRTQRLYRKRRRIKSKKAGGLWPFTKTKRTWSSYLPSFRWRNKNQNQNVETETLLGQTPNHSPARVSVVDSFLVDAEQLKASTKILELIDNAGCKDKDLLTDCQHLRKFVRDFIINGETKMNGDETKKTESLREKEKKMRVRYFGLKHIVSNNFLLLDKGTKFSKEENQNRHNMLQNLLHDLESNKEFKHIFSQGFLNFLTEGRTRKIEHPVKRIELSEPTTPVQPLTHEVSVHHQSPRKQENDIIRLSDEDKERLFPLSKHIDQQELDDVKHLRDRSLFERYLSKGKRKMCCYNKGTTGQHLIYNEDPKKPTTKSIDEIFEDILKINHEDLEKYLEHLCRSYVYLAQSHQHILRLLEIIKNHTNHSGAKISREKKDIILGFCKKYGYEYLIDW
jgi:hypothetical protein